MKWVTSFRGTLHIQDKSCDAGASDAPGFMSSISPRAVHELLFDPASGGAPPLFLALTAAGPTANEEPSRALVWIDPAGTFYPPAVLRGLGRSAGPLDVLRPEPADLAWATAECLRCRQVRAVVALWMHRPTRVEVRRLQLAAEHGGGVGLLLRPNLPAAGADVYAAATRWLVSPAPGERTVQRWRVRQVHGHGRQTNSSYLLEKDRASGQARFVRLPTSVVRHPALSAAS
jgi:hypothetical protein